MTMKLIALDFDGVIHSYTSPWDGPTVIPDPPVPGALDFLLRASRRFRVAIYSSRSNEPGGIFAMKEWLSREFHRLIYGDGEGYDADLHGRVVEFMSDLEWPTCKPPAFITIDDRAITFTGEWPDLDVLESFKPWNKK